MKDNSSTLTKILIISGIAIFVLAIVITIIASQ